ncbi:MAG: radical SAM protein [Candidatus Coatesbacteria bacterium]|nr:radical SAM protein [Candidatus Coatesbacteria bacterium]
MGILSYAKTYALRRLFQVIFQVTFRCNARCSFCFNLDELNQRLDEELSFDEIRKFSRSMPKFEWLMISGGEPFLRDDLPEILETFASNNRVKHITVPTNAIAKDKVLSMAPELIKACPESSISIVLSLDAIGEQHDKIRGVPGTFDKVLSVLGSLKELQAREPRLTLKLETVVTDANLGQMGEIIEFVHRLDPDLHILDLERGGFKGWMQEFPANYDIDPVIRESFRVLRESRGYASLNEHAPMLAKVSKSVQAEYFSMLPQLVHGERLTKCLAGRMTLVLYPRGDVAACEVLPNCANIRDFDLDYEQTIRSEPFSRQVAAISEHRCTCFHPCYQTVNILFSPKHLVRALFRRKR